NWPGNVRQLRNVIERACLLAEGEWITEAEVPSLLSGGGHDAVYGEPMPARTAPVGVPLREIERSAVVAALDACRGNKTHAAVRLGISRRALYRLIDGFGLGPVPADAD
ncbi:MAG: Fis family transcriptional regulator, partial [bacterium]